MLDVKKLQAALGVARDGIAGPVTLARLFGRLGAKADWAEELGLSAAVHLPPSGILSSPMRLAHFAAQLCHESDQFRTMEEYASGAAYEGRRDLGNIQPGDGVRYKGRAPIQCTGRANYRKFGHRIGIDLERHPQLAAIPSIGLHVSVSYWLDRGLNALADRDDIRTITIRINGGLTGFADRQRHLARIKSWLL